MQPAGERWFPVPWARGTMLDDPAPAGPSDRLGRCWSTWRTIPRRSTPSRSPDRITRYDSGHGRSPAARRGRPGTQPGWPSCSTRWQRSGPPDMSTRRRRHPCSTRSTAVTCRSTATGWNSDPVPAPGTRLLSGRRGVVRGHRPLRGDAAPRSWRARSACPRRRLDAPLPDRVVRCRADDQHAAVPRRSRPGAAPRRRGACGSTPSATRRRSTSPPHDVLERPPRRLDRTQCPRRHGLLVDGPTPLKTTNAPGPEPRGIRTSCGSVESSDSASGASSRGSGASPRPSSAKISALRYSKSSSSTSPAANFSFNRRNSSSSASSSGPSGASSSESEDLPCRTASFSALRSFLRSSR